MPSLPHCYAHPRPSITTDCVILGIENNDIKILLIERKGAPYQHCWALPGGFLNMDETVEECARRELEEETGLIINDLQQLGVFSKIDRDPRERVITVAFYATTNIKKVIGSDDAAQARWFSVKKLPPLAFDHQEILNKALSQLEFP